MKRLLLIVILAFILCGCSKKEEIKEYDINTYFDLANKHKDKVNERFKKLTSTEIEEKESQIRKEVAKEVGLPYNETILLRGKKSNNVNDSVLLIVEDIDDSIGVLCLFNHEQDFSWIKEGETVLIKGKLDNDLYLSLANCELISPTTKSTNN